MHLLQFKTRTPYLKNDSLCFILGEYGDSNCPGSISYLYFVNNKTTVKKRLIVTHNSNDTAHVIYKTITPWYKGVLVKTNTHYECYNMLGDSLFSLPAFSGGVSTSYNAINYEEYINLPINSTTTSAARINIRTEKCVWVNNNIPIASTLPSNARIDNYSISKKSNIWTYTINYTTYEGEKKSFVFSLNIDTGKCSD